MTVEMVTLACVNTKVRESQRKKQTEEDYRVLHLTAAYYFTIVAIVTITKYFVTLAQAVHCSIRFGARRALTAAYLFVVAFEVLLVLADSNPVFLCMLQQP